MKRQIILRHEFVEFIPKQLPEGVVYVSIPYTTAIHNCACGCGSRVVTPLSPVDWTLIFNGRVISLEPSIGNWDFPCRSHYWIKNNKIIWSHEFSDVQIEAVRKKDDRDSSDYFGGKHKRDKKIVGDGMENRKDDKTGLWGWIKSWFSGK